MFRVGCTENIVAVFGEQDNDYQADSQVTISLSVYKLKGTCNCASHINLLLLSDLFSNFFGLEKLDKVPREVFTPELQKVHLQASHANFTLDK